MSEKTVHTCELKTREDRRNMEVNVKSFGKIVASEDTLHTISMCILDSATLNVSKGKTPLAILQMEAFKSIYNALADAGYYGTIHNNIN